MMELLGIIAGLLGIAGVLLNNRKLLACFPVWLLSNGLSAGIHLAAGLYAVAGRDLVFFLLALDGWRRWRMKS